MMETRKTTTTRRSQSLQFKIGLTLIVLTTLILAGFGVYQYLALRAEKMAYLTYVADSTIARLAQNLAMPLWNFDTDQVEDALLAEMRERTISAIVVDDTSGNRLAGTQRDEAWEVIEMQAELAESDMLRSQDIVNGDEYVGHVELHLTQQFMIVELTREIRNLVMAVVIVDLVLFFVLGVSVQRLLIQPLNRLVTIANAVAQGDFRQQIDIRQQDEIGNLADAFRNMQGQIDSVLNETNDLSQAVQGGQLETRGNAEAFSGGWRDLMVGINSVIDAFVDPITTTANTVDLRKIQRLKILKTFD